MVRFLLRKASTEVGIKDGIHISDVGDHRPKSNYCLFGKYMSVDKYTFSRDKKMHVLFKILSY